MKPPASPFFAPATPHVVVVQQTPGGTRHAVSKKQEVHETKSTVMGCTANLINAIVGSGIVGIPYAVRQAGFGAGIVLIVICAILTEKSLRLLINTAKHVHVPSYETVAEAAFGTAGFRFVAVNMFVMAYGAMLSYLMIVKDSFSLLVGIDPDDLPMKRAVLVAVSLTVMVPLSSQRDMANLSFTSRFSVVIDTILVGLVVYNSPIDESLERIGGFATLFEPSQIVHWDTIFVGLGVLSFAFVCQHSAFIIAGSLDRPTTHRWSTVTRSALSVCVVLALTCGFTGYLGYMDNTQGNVLMNLDPESWTANLARGMLGITMLFVFPLECFVARHVCVVLLFRGRRAHEGEDSTILNRADRRIGLTVILYLLAVVPAAAFEDLGPVLAITGAVGGSCLAYIGPGVVYLGIHGGRFLELVRESWLGSKLGAATLTETSRGMQTANHAVETTPLVADTVEAVEAKREFEKEQADLKDRLEEESFMQSLLKSIVWYGSLMPMWCAVASYGRQGLTSHIHEMALKSPHPIRIGAVQYKRVRVVRGRVDVDPEEGRAIVIPPFSRTDSLPILSAKDSNALGGSGSLAHAPGGKPNKGFAHGNAGNINQKIGQSLVEQQQQKELEIDPQEELPSWFDFGVAIFYIMFGVLAFVAGIISLSQ
jgi:sodium-coupled neutral amino acid transporter 11